MKQEMVPYKENNPIIFCCFLTERLFQRQKKIIFTKIRQERMVMVKNGHVELTVNPNLCLHTGACLMTGFMRDNQLQTMRNVHGRYL